MDVQEIRKLDDYLQRLFDNAEDPRRAAAEEGRIPPRSISARNSSACCSSTTRTTSKSYNFQMAILGSDLDG